MQLLIYVIFLLSVLIVWTMFTKGIDGKLEIPVPKLKKTGKAPENVSQGAFRSLQKVHPKSNVIDVLTDKHLFIYAATRNGKSILVEYLLHKMLTKDTQVVVINPHYQFNQYGLHARDVVASGRKYHNIQNCFDRIVGIMNQRFEQYSSEECSFNPLIVLIEELPACVKNTDKGVVSKFVQQLSSESLKVNIRLIVVSQSKLVRQCGFEGASDMLENFALIRVSKPYYYVTTTDEEGNENILKEKFSINPCNLSRHVSHNALQPLSETS